MVPSVLCLPAAEAMIQKTKNTSQNQTKVANVANEYSKKMLTNNDSEKTKDDTTYCYENIIC